MLEFPCAHCGRRLKLDATWAGKKCRCGHCKQVVDVPQPAAVAGSASPSSSLISRPSTPAPRAAASLADMQTLPPTHELSTPDGRAQPGRTDRSSPSHDPATSAELFDFLSPPQAADELGRLGGYRVFRVLGAGGMGVVYDAEDPLLKRPVALKAMLPVMASSPSNRQRFALEAQAAAAIEHDHIVTIYQVGEDRGIPFIAMQLLKGESLEERLQRVGRIGLADGLVIAKQIASGLAVAHERGLIHRDIKPSNLFLVSDGPGSQPAGTSHATPVAHRYAPLAEPHSLIRVKILDFGLARSVAGDSQLTKNGAIIGTPAYMAPEQSRAQRLDGRCDLFSLGCVLYRMFTGRLPFQGEDAITILLALAGEDPPPPHHVVADVPPRVSQLIMDLLAKDPKLRPPTARAVIQRIQMLESEMAEAVPVTVGLAAPARAHIVNPEPVPLAGLSATILETYVDTPVAKKKKAAWLLPVGLALAGLLLLAGVLGIVSALNGPQPDKALPKTVKPVAATVKLMVPEPAIDPAIIALIRSAVRDRNYAQTEVVGFPLSAPFEEIPADGGLLIGFKITLGKFIQTDIIQSIQPIFLTEKGEIPGQVHGKPSDRMVVVKAKKGYAVGAVKLDTHLRIDGMKITFMRIDKTGSGKFLLDAEQSYQSERIGTLAAGAGKTVGGTGALVIGICGKSKPDACDAFGLVLRGKVKP